MTMVCPAYKLLCDQECTSVAGSFLDTWPGIWVAYLQGSPNLRAACQCSGLKVLLR